MSVDRIVKLIDATKSLTVAHLMLMGIGGIMTITLVFIYENRNAVFQSALESKLLAIFVSAVVTIMIVIWVVSAVLKHIDEKDQQLRQLLEDRVSQLEDDLERANVRASEHEREIERLRHSEANCLHRVRELKAIMLSHNISVPSTGFDAV